MSVMNSLRQRAMHCRSHAYEVPDAGSREELLAEAEGLEQEAGGTREADRERGERDKMSPAVTAVAARASVAIVVAVAALPVMAIIRAFF